MAIKCPHCGSEKTATNGLCPNCMKFSSLEPSRPTEAARHAAFSILQRHPDCLRDDVVLNDLIDDIATAIDHRVIA